LKEVKDLDKNIKEGRNFFLIWVVISFAMGILYSVRTDPTDLVFLILSVGFMIVSLLSMYYWRITKKLEEIKAAEERRDIE